VIEAARSGRNEGAGNMADQQRGRRFIEVNRQIIAPCEPRPMTVRQRRIEDYPRLSAAHGDVARKLASPLRMGPPICDELVALVEHLFTEEEAGVARHLGLFAGRSAIQLAKAEHRPLDEVQPILDRLADEKRIIVCSGEDAKRRYRLLPIVPGIFEMTLIAYTPETLTPWHRRFIELFETLVETGYVAEYDNRTSLVRFLPVGKAIEAHPAALPSDKLEVVLDQFDCFAVGQCQCRLTMHVLGQGCGKPMGNCMMMGQWARKMIDEGIAHEVSKSEALAIKREAEEHGMVNWIMNVESTRGQCSCSCCGCCCHAMRTVNEFNAPATMAPPHFVPRFDPSKCVHCGKCAKNCPMGAIRVDLEGKTLAHLKHRCIGCGLCAVACNGRKAVTMEAVPDYQLPYKSWFSLIAHAAPGMLRKSFDVWRQRR
jgi:Na+-translocating ferredoxin:NAD+ oxidoreductase subunit B